MTIIIIYYNYFYYFTIIIIYYNYFFNILCMMYKRIWNGSAEQLLSGFAKTGSGRRKVNEKWEALEKMERVSRQFNYY